MSEMKKKFFIIFWSLAIVGIASFFLIFKLIAMGKIGYMPPIEELENPKNTVATELYSADGKVLSTYYYSRTGNRLVVDYDGLSPYLVNMLIATEDVRFKEHSGIDARAMIRVFFKRIILRRKAAGGGSTITQQLAKQLYSPTAGSIIQRLFQKPIEWVIAVQLERFYTKEEIITMYFNQYDFSHNAVGIKTASWVYFGKKPKELSPEEAATLVGMCQNSSLYNPLRRKELVRKRRNVVLTQTCKAGYITNEQCDSLKTLPLVLHYHRMGHKTGIAQYFREYLRLTLTHEKPVRKHYASWQDQQFRDDSLSWATNPLFGWCNKNFKEDGKPYNLYTDGLKIYSTIDSRMQEYAEEAVDEHIKELQKLFYREKKGRQNAPYTDYITKEQVDDIMKRNIRQSERYRVMKKAGYSDKDIIKIFNVPVKMSVFSYHGYVDTTMAPIDSIKYYKFFLRAGFMSMNPHNGHVKAYVGGISFSPFQYDMVTKGRRQVGSTIKPYLYSLAMEEGYSPCDEVVNQPVTIVTETGEAWSPRNDGIKDVGKVVTLKWGLAKSNNWISAYLMSHFSPYAFKRMLRSFGLNGHIDPVVSLCVGTCDATVAEMVSAYSSFVNKGIRVRPLFVTRIEDNNGNILAHFSPKMYEVFSEKTSFKMLSMLQAVINEGTGVRVRYRYGMKAQMGGKTGTTQNNSDGWFMNILPNLVSGVWVGGEDRDIHFDRITEGQGANMALPIWCLYMKKVYNDKNLDYSEDDKFIIPKGYEYDCPTMVKDATGKEDSNLMEGVFDQL